MRREAIAIPTTDHDSSQLLLNEEITEMRQLPSASSGENDELDNTPPDDTRIGSLGLIAEFSLAFLDEDK